MAFVIAMMKNALGVFGLVKRALQTNVDTNAG